MRTPFVERQKFSPDFRRRFRRGCRRRRFVGVPLAVEGRRVDGNLSSSFINQFFFETIPKSETV